ncbi:hypothetical protein NQ317_012958 [Molorchus minor]|uniref:Uncharacterized protein n=1 Tax=Molorchus minor TaxID=1323400 RepID=A0ABQ9IX32_9CUCU|nr:hypothetical protein NQ317_012958 [Molorchus minor]
MGHLGGEKDRSQTSTESEQTPKETRSLHTQGEHHRYTYGGRTERQRGHKHKSDTVVLEAGKENEKNDLHRRWSENAHAAVPSDMGNKPSVSEGEEDEDRPALSLKGAKSLGSEIANGGGEDADEEVELPPPMKPIQEPILVTSPPPGYPTSRRILVRG